MTLQQEAYNRIDQMTDDGIKVIIDIIDKMKTVSITGFKSTDENGLLFKEDATSSNKKLSKEEQKALFLKSAGTIQIDADAVKDLRERSMI